MKELVLDFHCPPQDSERYWPTLLNSCICSVQGALVPIVLIPSILATKPSTHRLEMKSLWNDQSDSWTIPNIELAGNRVSHFFWHHPFPVFIFIVIFGICISQLRPQQKKPSSSSKRAQSARRDRGSRDKRTPKQEHDAAFVNEYDEYVVKCSYSFQ